MWIFGYGSLIFRPGFAFRERRSAHIPGWVRRFWQGSPDHRGTPEAPGRVATLVAEPAAWCGGCAYRIDPAEAKPILRALDEREVAGFERRQVPLHDRAGGDPFAQGTTWIAEHGNPHFAGTLDEPAIAAYVRRSHGPSGANSDYVIALADALRELGIEDAHVEAIRRAL